MKTPMPFAILSFTQFLLIAISPFVSADLIDNTCKETPHPDFCASNLRSDPRSSTPDTPTLGLIMVDKVDTNAKLTVTKIQDLLSQSPDPRMKIALTSCVAKYNFIISSYVPQSKVSFASKDYQYAQDCMSDVATDVSDCEKGFRGKSPISNSNDFENKAASVAEAIACSLA